MHPYVSTSYLSVDIKQCWRAVVAWFRSMLIEDESFGKKTDMTHPRLIEWWMILPVWPEASVRCLAAIRPESGLCHEDVETSCCVTDEGRPFGAAL